MTYLEPNIINVFNMLNILINSIFVLIKSIFKYQKQK